MIDASSLTASNGIYRSDCLTLLERIEPGALQLAYVDPPWYLDIQTTELEVEDVSDTGELLAAHMVWIGQILQQIRRVLSETGSVFFHSVAGAPGNYKLLLDQIFGRDARPKLAVGPQLHGLGLEL